MRTTVLEKEKSTFEFVNPFRKAQTETKDFTDYTKGNFLFTAKGLRSSKDKLWFSSMSCQITVSV